jgi:hypothetical protein
VLRIRHWLLTEDEENVENGQILWAHTYATVSSKPRGRRVQCLVPIGSEMWIYIRYKQTNIQTYKYSSLYIRYVFFWVIPRHLSTNSRRLGTLYRFHLQRQVDEVGQGLGCVGYLYRTGFRQVGGGANGKVSDRLGVGGQQHVSEGVVYKA